jgi:hypothetical protein
MSLPPPEDKSDYQDLYRYNVWSVCCESEDLTIIMIRRRLKACALPARGGDTDRAAHWLVANGYLQVRRSTVKVQGNTRYTHRFLRVSGRALRKPCAQSSKPARRCIVCGRTCRFDLCSNTCVNSPKGQRYCRAREGLRAVKKRLDPRARLTARQVAIAEILPFNQRAGLKGSEL